MNNSPENKPSIAISELLVDGKFISFKRFSDAKTQETIVFTNQGISYSRMDSSGASPTVVSRLNPVDHMLLKQRVNELEDAYHANYNDIPHYNPISLPNEKYPGYYISIIGPRISDIIHRPTDPENAKLSAVIEMFEKVAHALQPQLTTSNSEEDK